MIKRCFALELIMLLLCSCSYQSPSDESSPAASMSSELLNVLSPTPSSTPDQETSNPATDYTPTVRASNTLGDGGAVIAEYEYRWSDKSDRCVFLMTDEHVSDMLISGVYENEDGYIESEAFLYVPELTAGQAVNLFDAHSDHDYWRVAYTNSRGTYEATLLVLTTDDGIPKLIPTEPKLLGDLYDKEYYEYFNLFPEDFYEKMLAGAFDAYVPKGLCISTGSLGDVNGDGVEDALICLMTGGYRAAAYSGIMPLLVLIGQPDGGYIVEKKNTRAFFTPYRSSSYPVAGNSYIDIIYDFVGGAACHHTQVYRFCYDSEISDWLLKGFSYQPTFALDYSDKVPSELVCPLPNFADLPLDMMVRDVYDEQMVDWDYFDVVGELVVPSWGDNNEVYTLAVNLNEATGCYEGYI